MTGIEKGLAGAGVVLSTLLVFEIYSLIHRESGKTQAASPQNATKPALVQDSGFARSQAVQPMREQSLASPVVVVNNPLPAGATSIPDASLLHLSTMVNLAEARDRQPDKAQWTEALSVARGLLQGPCDCEQRNWLNHFIEMGNDALSNSSEYYKLAQQMATMPRNDNAAMALSRKSN